MSGVGPITIFDKSALQSFNPDEALWFDWFYKTNLTPLFYVETLADLNKQMRGGRTPDGPGGGFRELLHELTAGHGSFGCCTPHSGDTASPMAS